jgi:hypothetical protein
MKIFASLILNSKKHGKTRYPIMDLHNWLVQGNHDYEKQMSIILLHIYLGAISWLIINA